MSKKKLTKDEKENIRTVMSVLMFLLQLSFNLSFLLIYCHIYHLGIH